MIEVVDLGHLTESEQRVYAKRVLELLLTNNMKIGSRSIEAYTAIYGTSNQRAPELSELKARCFTGKTSLTGVCKEVASTAGSKPNFESLRKIPLDVSEDTIQEILKIKKQFLINK